MSKWNKIAVLIITVFQFASVAAEYQQCSAKPVIHSGTAVFGALVDVHYPGSGNVGCEAIDSVQAIEAMKWALDKINKNDYVPGIKLGMHVYDTCGTPYLAVKSAMDFVPNTYLKEYSQCRTYNSTELFLGLAGPGRSGPAVAVAQSLEMHEIPIIAYSATLAELGNATLYPSFFRTVPPDNVQSRVIVDIVKKLGWKFIATINTDDNYGRDGIKEFIRLAEVERICISRSEEVPVSSADDGKINRVMENLLNDLNGKANEGMAMGVVYFGQAQTASKLIREQKKLIETGGYKTLRNLYWVMSDAVGVSGNMFQYLEQIAYGIINVTPAFLYSSTFKDHWVQTILDVVNKKFPIQSDPWIEEYVMKAYECTISESVFTNHTFTKNCNLVTRREIENQEGVSNLVDNAFDVVYVFAKALKNAQRDTCGHGYYGICRALADMTSSQLMGFIRNVRVNYQTIGSAAPTEKVASRKELSFDKNGEVQFSDNSPAYFVNIFKGNKFEHIGNYSTNGLMLDLNDVQLKNANGEILSGETLPISSCTKDCGVCLHKRPVEYIFVPGDDILILGFFSVHEKGSTPFTCGQFRNLTASVQLVEAFLHALDNVNSGRMYRNYIGGLKFGGLVFDDCYSPARAGNLLLSFLKGDLKLTDPKTGAVIDPSMTAAVVGSFSSSVTTHMAEILTEFNIPLISYGSTSTRLSDRTSYPYFLRTVPDNYGQAQVMVDVINKLGWNFVQTVNTANTYGRSGIEAFKKISRKHNIHLTCPDEPNEIPFKRDMPAIKNMISKSFLTYSDAKALVFFGDDFHARDILVAMKERKIAQGTFIFIASAGWGTSIEIIRSTQEGTIGDIAAGHLTIDFTQRTSKSFDEYFRQLSPESHTSNPWFAEFWQDHFKCDLQQRFQYVYGRECSKTNRLSDVHVYPKQDKWVPYTMDAVYATAIGLKQVMGQLCHSESTFECIKKLKRDPINVVNSIKNVQLEGQTSVYRPFDMNGNGKIDYTIWNIQKNAISDVGYKYVEVGKYVSGKLSLDSSDIEFYEHNKAYQPTGKESFCQGIQCPQCSNTENSQLTDISCLQSKESNIGPVTIVFIVLFTLCIVILALQILYLIFYKKQVKSKAKASAAAGEENDRPLPPTPEQMHQSPPMAVADETPRRDQPETPPTHVVQDQVPHLTQRDIELWISSTSSSLSSRYNHIPLIYSDRRYQNLNGKESFTNLASIDHVSDSIAFENESDGESFRV